MKSKASKRMIKTNGKRRFIREAEAKRKERDEYIRSLIKVSKGESI